METLLARTGHVLLKFAAALKDALTDLEPNTGIALSMIGKLAWVIPLLTVPHLFNTFPTYYKEFAAGAPESAWAGLIGLIVCVDILALYHKAYALQMVSLLFNMFLWWFLGAMVAQGAPRGFLGLWGTPGSWTWACAAVGCLCGLVATGQKERTARNAADFLVWRRVMKEEESRGAAWIQPDRISETPNDQALNTQALNTQTLNTQTLNQHDLTGKQR